MINDILDISKIEAGKIMLEEIDFDLNYTIDGVYQTLHLKAEDQKLKLNVQIEPDVPRWVKGDPQHD